MNVLSLFDGMSCGQIALNKAGVKYNKYYASEIDKYAIDVAQSNYPYTIQLGDVTTLMKGIPLGEKVNKGMILEMDAHRIDLMLAGSPCQGFSVAGKQLDFNDPRSKLFFEFVRIKNAIDTRRGVLGKKPVKFLLENVPMKQESQDIISKYLGVQPITINSTLFSAQNRKRLYWSNIPFDIPTDDRGIILQDILEEDGIAHDAMTNKEGKSHCITARYNGAVWWNSIQRRQRTMVQVGEADNIKGFDSIKRIYSPNGKAPTLTTMQGGHREPKVAIGRIVNRRLDANGVRKDHQLELPLSSQLEISDSDKSNCLTTVNKDNVVVEGMQWRKLTPIECERLQTVPDNYTNHVSNSQRYKMLGNGWTVDVIAHIMKGLK